MKFPSCAATEYSLDTHDYHRFESKPWKDFSVLRLSTRKVFLLSNAVQQVNKVNAGLCPHGLPPAACPICSAGAGSMKQSDRNRKVGEMTYHECAMIGNMLKARALAQKHHEQNIQHRAENAKVFEITMQKLSTNLQQFIQQNAQTPIMKPIVFVAQNIVVPTLNFIRNIPKFLNNIKFEISDKLSAIYGEAKAFVEKKLSEIVDNLKNKLELLFKIFKKNNNKDDETKVDEDKKLFNLKTILHKILRKKKDDNNRKNKQRR